jgi:vacuolar-type H+-ATPase subunit E/Vma4
MATEELKIIITADNKDAVDKLVQAINATQKFGDTLKNTARPTADATNALSNLSRVAQDAPYGFMGIANNLNPLLESFQRLSKETGSSTSALKSMAAGLMGPAGIGLALGAVSSLFVAFGGDIVNFINGTDEAKKAQDEFNKSLEQAKQKAAEQATSLNLLIAVANSANASDEQRAKALNAVKEAIGKVNQDYASQIRTVADATEAVNLYTQALIQQAIVQRYQDKIADKTIELTNLTKEVAKATIEYSEAQKRAASMTNGYVDASVVQAGVIGSAKGKLEDATIAYNNTSDAIKELNNDLKVTTEEAVKMPFFTDLLLGKTASVKTPATKAVKEKDYSLQDNIAALENDIKATNKWADEQMKIYDKMYNFYKKYGDAVKAVTNVSSTRDMIQDQDKRREKQEEKIPISERKIEIPPNIKMMEQGIKKFDKELKDSQETMQKYAEFMASTLTDGIMVMFDAFASGENPLEALGNFVGDLVRKLAEAAIQAAILQGIMMLLPGGAASAAAGGGFFGSFKKILGMAEGGIVSRPTIAMVGEGGQSEAIMPLNKLGNMMNSTFAAGAMSGTGGGSGQFVLKGNDLVLALQRSNYSLNLRRGNGI